MGDPPIGLTARLQPILRESLDRYDAGESDDPEELASRADATLSRAELNLLIPVIAGRIATKRRLRGLAGEWRGQPDEPTPPYVPTPASPRVEDIISPSLMARIARDAKEHGLRPRWPKPADTDHDRQYHGDRPDED